VIEQRFRALGHGRHVSHGDSSARYRGEPRQGQTRPFP
jgi:hypothetical protein